MKGNVWAFDVETFLIHLQVALNATKTTTGRPTKRSPFRRGCLIGL